MIILNKPHTFNFEKEGKKKNCAYFSGEKKNCAIFLFLFLFSFSRVYNSDGVVRRTTPTLYKYRFYFLPSGRENKIYTYTYVYHSWSRRDHSFIRNKSSWWSSYFYTLVIDIIIFPCREKWWYLILYVWKEKKLTKKRKFKMNKMCGIHTLSPKIPHLWFYSMKLATFSY